MGEQTNTWPIQLSTPISPPPLPLPCSTVWGKLPRSSFSSRLWCAECVFTEGLCFYPPDIAYILHQERDTNYTHSRHQLQHHGREGVGPHKNILNVIQYNLKVYSRSSLISRVIQFHDEDDDNNESEVNAWLLHPSKLWCGNSLNVDPLFGDHKLEQDRESLWNF